MPLVNPSRPRYFDTPWILFSRVFPYHPTNHQASVVRAVLIVPFLITSDQLLLPLVRSLLLQHLDLPTTCISATSILSLCRPCFRPSSPYIIPLSPDLQPSADISHHRTNSFIVTLPTCPLWRRHECRTPLTIIPEYDGPQMLPTAINGARIDDGGAWESYSPASTQETPPERGEQEEWRKADVHVLGAASKRLEARADLKPHPTWWTVQYRGENGEKPYSCGKGGRKAWSQGRPILDGSFVRNDFRTKTDPQPWIRERKQVRRPILCST